MKIAAPPRLFAFPVLARAAFVLHRAPLSLNRTYAARAFEDKKNPGKWRAMIYSNGDAKKFADEVRDAGTMAARLQGWPTNLWVAAHVRICVYAFDTKTDAAAGNKIIADALEGVFYVNDSVVSWGEVPKPVNDRSGQRVEIIVDLIESRTPYEALNEEFNHWRRVMDRAARNDDPANFVFAHAELNTVRERMKGLAP